MEPQQRELQLRDDEVLVVARIGDERDVLAVARHVVARRPVARDGGRARDLLDEEGRAPTVDGLVVEVGAHARTAAVDTVEVERRDAEVADRLGVLTPRQARRRIEGHVVVEELADEREARGHRRVVRIRRAENGIHDEGERVGEIVTGVHDPARLADLSQRGPDRRGVRRERWQRREHPPEATLVVEGRLGSDQTGVSVSVAHAFQRTTAALAIRRIRGKCRSGAPGRQHVVVCRLVAGCLPGGPHLRAQPATVGHVEALADRPRAHRGGVRPTGGIRQGASCGGAPAPAPVARGPQASWRRTRRPRRLRA